MEFEMGPSFFSKTMSRNTFTEILKFLRFDDKTEPTSTDRQICSNFRYIEHIHRK